MFSPSGLGFVRSASLEPPAEAGEPASNHRHLMTGVHWLLAHCSVLKVRAVPPGRPVSPALGHQKAAGPLGAGGLPQLIGISADQARQATSRMFELSGRGFPIRDS